MKRLSIVKVNLICFCLVSGLLFSVNVGHCDDLSAGTGEIVADAEKAITNRELFVKWNRELWNCSENDLRLLTMDDNDTVSLSAAFELFVVRPAQNRTNRDELRTPETTGLPAKRDYQIDRADAARFVGFCEGRLKIPLPDWYLTVLEFGSVRHDRVSTYFVFRDGMHGLAIQKQHVTIKGDDNTELDWTVLSNAPNEVTVSGDNVVLDGTSAESVIPLSSVKTRGALQKGFAFTNDERRFWVTIYDRSILSEDDLLRFYVGDKVRWEADVWGTIPPSSMSLPLGNHYVSVVRNDNLVYVVGAGNCGAYVEGFDANSGKVVMRFTALAF
ncbi:hypothetical protein Mal52_21790 [Symmachiella dynata]|uniref:Uncharacterized protein n=1 Tax=Symmachiella dynata TaxID=2527995 RepID=A0A517ZMI8_9PLAN|nr:hypothetical protein [Symmachiella dynata]QDU43703.1 hypothetical protein Mal52_21790 [Symmachiella dynata]